MPARKILVLQEVTEDGVILQQISVTKSWKKIVLLTLKFAFDWAMVFARRDILRGPGMAKAETSALYIGYCRIASSESGPWNVAAKLCQMDLSK